MGLLAAVTAVAAIGLATPTPIDTLPVTPQALSQCFWNRGTSPVHWASVHCVSGSGYVRAAVQCKHYTSSGVVNGVTYDTGNWVGAGGTSWGYCPPGWRLTSWTVQRS